MSKIMYGIKASTGIRKFPDPGTPLETELLLGEGFEVEQVEQAYGVAWAFGKAVLDGYPGYVFGGDLLNYAPRFTHWVADAQAVIYRKPRCEYPTDLSLPMHAKVEATLEEGDFLHVPALRGWIRKRRLKRIGEHAEHFIAEARKFEHAPYVWGGRSGVRGIDCSALVQNAFLACGKVVPRDSGPQSETIGVPCMGEDFARGQLVFWPGHVGIMVNSVHILHASYADDRVLTEPLAEAVRKRGEPVMRRRV